MSISRTFPGWTRPMGSGGPTWDEDGGLAAVEPVVGRYGLKV